MSELVAASEPRLIAYNTYFDDERRHVGVVHVHADAASLDRHMAVMGPVLPQFVELIEMSSIDIYGEPSAAVVEKLRQKAETLGRGIVRVHSLHAGIARLPAP